MRYTLDHSEKDRMRHALEVAARAFKDDAANFKNAKANGMMTEKALTDFTNLFEQYHTETMILLSKIEDAETVTLERED